MLRLSLTQGNYHLHVYILHVVLAGFELVTKYKSNVATTAAQSKMIAKQTDRQAYKAMNEV